MLPLFSPLFFITSNVNFLFRLLRDDSEASGIQGTVMSNLRQKLEELESELKKEKLENSSIKVKFLLSQSITRVFLENKKKKTFT